MENQSHECYEQVKLIVRWIGSEGPCVHRHICHLDVSLKVEACLRIVNFCYCLVCCQRHEYLEPSFTPNYIAALECLPLTLYGEVRVFLILSLILSSASDLAGAEHLCELELVNPLLDIQNEGLKCVSETKLNVSTSDSFE
jgi:hypothetical protein